MEILLKNLNQTRKLTHRNVGGEEIQILARFLRRKSEAFFGWAERIRDVSSQNHQIQSRVTDDG